MAVIKNINIDNTVPKIKSFFVVIKYCNMHAMQSEKSITKVSTCTIIKFGFIYIIINSYTNKNKYVRWEGNHYH